MSKSPIFLLTLLQYFSGITGTVTIPANKLFQNTIKRWSIDIKDAVDRRSVLYSIFRCILVFLLISGWGCLYSIQRTSIKEKLLRPSNLEISYQNCHFVMCLKLCDYFRERWERLVRAKRAVERTTSGITLETLNPFTVAVSCKHVISSKS